jgi:hypothetical protein
MPLTASQLASFRIEAAGQSLPLQHAAAELRSHLARVSPDRSSRGVIRLEAGNGTTDGFEAAITRDRVTLRGDSPRGTLNAAYWLLEEAGFAWVEPGEDGVCCREGPVLADGVTRQAPAFPTRTLILGQDALHDDWPAWFDWASRNRLNDIFFHDTPPSRWDRAGASRPQTAAEQAADGGGWMFERWDADGPAIRDAAALRGLTLQFGGHHIPALLPRALFAEHPDWFPLRNGVRDAHYNLCTSSEGAREQLRRGALAFFDRFPGADVYHVWADDIRGGGWCECDRCLPLTPSDQALVATNLIAGALAAAVPGARIAHLAYHDTVQPPRTVRPLANVTLLWAPRERCYAHGIADPRCGKNTEEYWKPYTALLDLFPDPSAVQIFEYYSDAILFKGLAPTHLGALPADVAAYAPGAHNLQNLMVGNRPWVGPPWHAWWTARVSWDAAANPPEALTAFCEAAFPSNAAAMVACYQQQERAYRMLLDLHNLEESPRHDVLDFSGRPRSALGAKAPDLLEAALLLANCEKQLTALSATTPGESGRLARERDQAAAVSSVATHLANRVAAWDAILDGLSPTAADYLAKAHAALDRFEAWDAAHNTPAYANISRRMLRAMRYHTAEVERLISG